MTDPQFPEHRDMTEWVRPNGMKRTYRAPMTREAASVFDSVTKAGFRYSIEWIGDAYALYISDDDIEMDLVTEIVAGATSVKQRDALSRVIIRNPVDVVQRKKEDIIDMMSEDGGEA